MGWTQASREGCAGRFPSSSKPFGKFDELQDRFHPRILVGNLLGGEADRLAGLGIGGAAATIEREVKDRICVTLPVEAPWLRLNYGFIARRGPDQHARRQGVYGDRPGDREGNPGVNDGVSLEFPQRVG